MHAAQLDPCKEIRSSDQHEHHMFQTMCTPIHHTIHRQQIKRLQKNLLKVPIMKIH